MPQIAMHEGPLPSVCMHAQPEAMWTHPLTHTGTHTLLLSSSLSDKHPADDGFYNM